MKSTFFVPLLAVLLSAPCYASSSSESNSSSINVSDEQSVATIKGRAGIAVIQGDKVELDRRTVYVNGLSYGKVPDLCEIQYIVTKTARTLYVDGKPRSPAAK
ncbi:MULTISPECIES: hypothetical protein [unclassified Duganella]|uniref:hypothetical protein n=1 Tax=unclassified Duganella TaxID=2636909 RepID=UPI0011C19FDB|nr:MULTISPECIES: hypothetical protein [unclassified Duganella]